MALKKTVSTAKTTKKTINSIDPSTQLRNAVVEGMQEVKAKDIVCIDLRNIKNAVADFFVICHADSSTHIDVVGTEFDIFVDDVPLMRRGRFLI